MKNILTFGFFGTEFGISGGSTAQILPEEPILSLEKIIKFFSLQDKQAGVKIDFDLVYGEKDIKAVWAELAGKKQKWNEIKKALLKLMSFKDSLLPIVFEINYDSVSIEIVAGEETILVETEDKSKLEEFKQLIEKESEKRVTPYGQIGAPKATLNSGRAIVLK